MSGPGPIDVDEAASQVSWREGREQVRAFVAGAFDARHDPVSDGVVVLTKAGDSGAVELLSRQGRRLAMLSPPAGYRISHFAESTGLGIVCQGQAPDGAWWDWHFDLDTANGTMRRTGPAY